MQINHIPNQWLYPESLAIAAETQRALAEKAILEDYFNKPNIVAGVDVSNNLFDPKQMVYAGIVNIDVKKLNAIETTSTATQQAFPYRTGFLGFREAPVIIKALEKLQHTPDIILVDGHGISHPRHFGIATHLGVLLDIPTIGVAKTILVGKPECILGNEVGDHIPLIWQGKKIAYLLRSKKNCNPLIISPGHRISFDSALKIAMQCLKGYRLPEPTRLAHLAANQCRLNF